MSPDLPAPDPAPQPWRVNPVLPVTKLLGGVALIVLLVAFGRHDRVQWLMAIAVAVGLAAWAARDLLVPVRLAADADGLTVVVSFAGRRRLTWDQVQTLRVDRRGHFGLKTELLEIDTADGLYLLGLHDLGANPADVLAELQRLSSVPRSGPAPQ